MDIMAPSRYRPPVGVALIALVGVVVSVLGAFWTTSRQLKHEQAKVREQYQHQYLGKLYDRRLATYPALYQTLSGLAKCLRVGASAEDLAAAEREIRCWDNEHAIFVSDSTASLLIKLRSELRDRSTEGDEAELLDMIGGVEKALKRELGVFSREAWREDQ